MMIKRNYEKYFRYLSEMISSEIEELKDIVRNTDLKDDKYFNKLFKLPEIVKLILKVEIEILNDIINFDSEYNQNALKNLSDQEIESKAMALIKAALTIREFRFELDDSFIELKGKLESFYKMLMYEGIFLFFLIHPVDARLLMLDTFQKNRPVKNRKQ